MNTAYGITFIVLGSMIGILFVAFLVLGIVKPHVMGVCITMSLCCAVMSVFTIGSGIKMVEDANKATKVAQAASSGYKVYSNGIEVSANHIDWDAARYKINDEEKMILVTTDTGTTDPVQKASSGYKVYSNGIEVSANHIDWDAVHYKVNDEDKTILVTTD
jgi:hypothetical protein